LEELLIEKGGFSPEEITLFRGTNDSARAQQAWQRWQHEVGESLPAYQRPSRSVAVRLALVHEFKTRSQVFISTEAGAKGLNLQFCDTIINYDLPWNPQRIEQRIGRCHRYSQEHDVTVINFLAADNEAQKLMFDILVRKLDLFGKVLDASDAVLHEPSTDTPETLAGALGSDFETRLRRIYERARTVAEIEDELRRLREQMEEERKNFEQTWARTAGLIETRFDQRVKQVFRSIQAGLPEGLAEFDNGMDRLITGFLGACEIPYQRSPGDGAIRFEISPSNRLPDGWKEGGVVVIGRAKGSTTPREENEAENIDTLHLGHPLVQAAVEEARHASRQTFSVRWKLDKSAPVQLKGWKGKPGRLRLSRIRYEGFERVDRLIPAAVIEGETAPMDLESGRWLLEREPQDMLAVAATAKLDDALEDAMQEVAFADQAEFLASEQQRFERNLEQIERYVEDRLLVLKRRLAAALETLRTAEDKRDSALGAEARTQAESRIIKVQHEIDAFEAEIRRLQNRDDPEYERWRQRAYLRRFQPPEATRILEADFVLG
jgi:hypothetical protein